MKRKLKPCRFSGEYFLSKRQMQEAKVIEWQMNGKIKRGEIKNFTLCKCGCGCGVFASPEIIFTK